MKIKSIILPLFAVFALGISQNAAAFGAIAASEQDDGVHIGFFVGANGEFAAQKGAIKGCVDGGGTNCKIAETFSDICVAIAVSDSNSEWAYAAYSLNYDEQEALKDAIATCEQNQGVNCVQHASGCDGSIPSEEDLAEFSLPQICAQLCGDFEEQESFSGNLSLFDEEVRQAELRELARREREEREERERAEREEERDSNTSATPSLPYECEGAFTDAAKRIDSSDSGDSASAGACNAYKTARLARELFDSCVAVLSNDKYSSSDYTVVKSQMQEQAQHWKTQEDAFLKIYNQLSGGSSSCR